MYENKLHEITLSERTNEKCLLLNMSTKLKDKNHKLKCSERHLLYTNREKAVYHLRA